MADTPQPLTPEELDLYRAELADAPSMADVPEEPLPQWDLVLREWADRCRRLLATLDRDRERLAALEGALVTHFPFLRFAKDDGLPYLVCACGWDDLGNTGWGDHMDAALTEEPRHAD